MPYQKKSFSLSFLIQVLLPVIQEIPVDPEIIRIFVIDLVNTTTIKAVDLCIRVRKDYRGVGGDDELHISAGAELSQQA
jgi:hypothetical protein